MEIQNTWGSTDMSHFRLNVMQVFLHNYRSWHPEFYPKNLIERKESMKTYKLEFVLFNISHENAVFLWKWIVDALQFFGFDVTGNVSAVENSAFSEEE